MPARVGDNIKCIQLYDGAGAYYERCIADELDPYNTNGVKMIALDKVDGIWKASKKFFASNLECVRSGRKVGSHCIYNFAVFKAEGDEEAHIVIGHHRRHVHITNAVFQDGRNRDKRVRFAGQIAFDDQGQIVWWDNKSGHYRPPTEGARAMFSLLPEEKFWSWESQKKVLLNVEKKKLMHHAAKLCSFLGRELPGINRDHVSSWMKSHSFTRKSPPVTKSSTQVVLV